MDAFIFEQQQLPLAAEQTKELLELWEPIFPESCEEFLTVCEGQEADCNDDYVFTARLEGDAVASLRLTVSKSQPAFSGVGEVVTTERCRGKGIATALTEKATELFKDLGGEALFLGTYNPAAASVYQKSGWKCLPASDVYVNVLTGQQPEEYLLNYFKDFSGDFSFGEFSAGQRIGLIPLALYPHDFRDMDRNASLQSTRYEYQKSCMGLFPKYLKVIENGGKVIPLYKGDILAGMFTAVKEGKSKCVDGFVMSFYADKWAELLGTVAEKFSDSSDKCIVKVDRKDIWKRRAASDSSLLVEIESADQDILTFEIKR
ncbi:MAG: GNAT family N-acetyltransferase [Planctomycetota bacterium]|jgi:GNAT superfamily N-acetyltransferase